MKLQRMNLSLSRAKTVTPKPAARLQRRTVFWVGIVLLFIVLPLLSHNLFPSLTTFPDSLNIGLREPIDNFQSWVIGNRKDHPMFLYFFNPLSQSIDTLVRGLETLLENLPWLFMVTLAFVLGLRASGWRVALFCAAGLLFAGFVGLWQEAMQTLALMGLSVILSLIIGIPLGIVSGLSKRFEHFLRPILDVMQTMPAFVYLIPVVLFFGIARVPAVIATVIYALPPAIRFTSLGIQQISPAALEAARAFGSTNRQLLFKIRLPLAAPTIVAGINQTIMMAFGIVVIAALIGANGLGKTVMQTLQKLQVGRGLEAGLAIAFLAIMLDRISYGFSKPKVKSFGHTRRFNEFVNSRSFWLVTLTVLALILAVHFFITPLNDFPKDWRVKLYQPVDTLVKWSRDNLYQIGNLPLGTGPFSDFLVLYCFNPLNRFLNWLPWPLLVAGFTFVVTRLTNWRLGLFTCLSLLGIGLLGMWEEALLTLAQVVIGTLITVMLALWLGIWSARSERGRKFLELLLDMLQTIPSFIYLIPVVMLFNIGVVPGIIASVLYALPPGIRLISLGIRGVDKEAVEAATAFGSTRRQTLYKVELPLALPSLMLGVNQIIMMILAMVIIAGLIGGSGLGLEAVTGLARNETGRGLEAGIAIVLMAMVLDRVTQALAQASSNTKQPAPNNS
jgi:glycine betaine/proline transport system permease protein